MKKQLQFENDHFSVWKTTLTPEQKIETNHLVIAHHEGELQCFPIIDAPLKEGEVLLLETKGNKKPRIFPSIPID